MEGVFSRLRLTYRVSLGVPVETVFRPMRPPANSKLRPFWTLSMLQSWGSGSCRYPW